MAEAEDVLVDAARHTTVFVRDLWRRHRPPDRKQRLTLADLAPRLDLLLIAVFGTGLVLRSALPPAHPTLLERVFRRQSFPRNTGPLPATDGTNIWLPAEPAVDDPEVAADLLRAMAVQQACRALRGGAHAIAAMPDPLLRDLVLLHEARAAEAEVARKLPGLIPALALLRSVSLRARPPVSAFPAARRPLEALLQDMLTDPIDTHARTCATFATSLAEARAMLASWHPTQAMRRQLGPAPLLRDWWTGEYRASDAPALRHAHEDATGSHDEDAPPLPAARMPRRPEVRAADDDEDKAREAGAWMVQQDHPHEVAEDPFGLHRPLDRDDQTGAEEFGDMLSELSAARMVSSPERAREVLLSDDPPTSRTTVSFVADACGPVRFRYPEWNWRRESYLESAVTVHLLSPRLGEQQWIDTVLADHRSLLEGIRRQFEVLRARPMRLRRQSDGEEIDLDALVESHADLRAGGAHNDTLYETRRPGHRSIAIVLLVDASGSTDGWIGGGHRVIDVEREALLLVCIALEELGEPFTVQTFSGEGPHGVTMRVLKDFDERYCNEVALRIAGLEPERYTRAGAALRHATAQLMRQPAEHRLLLLLSDGKPNDADHYDGRYGLEDTRQAINEARMQGVFPFCLTIDRQAANYLPQVFGASGYALLQTPKRLPMVLLDWLRRLIAH
jgi:nitric oxide reductase NorD protein